MAARSARPAIPYLRGPERLGGVLEVGAGSATRCSASIQGLEPEPIAGLEHTDDAGILPTDPEPDAELAAVKARARRAYLDAKRKGAAPPAMCDKLHADTLLALGSAPPRAQVVVMAYRSELLFRILSDRTRRLDRPG
jgi:hypothetical protein